MFQGYDCGSIVFQRQAANANSDRSECQLIVYKQLLNLDTNSMYSFQVTKASTAKHDAFLHHLHMNQVKQHALTITVDKQPPSKWLCKIIYIKFKFPGLTPKPVHLPDQWSSCQSGSAAFNCVDQGTCVDKAGGDASGSLG